MFARHLIALVAALLLAGERGVCAEASNPFAAVLNDPVVFYYSLGAAAHQLEQAGPCLEPCRAMRDMESAYRVLEDRDVPNTMARLPPIPDGATLDRQRERAVRRAIQHHPARAPLYCTILVKVADHVGGEDRIPMTQWTVELAARLDRPGLDCLGPVLAALPHTPDEAATVADVRDTCRANRSNPVPGWAWCDRFLRRRS